MKKSKILFLFMAFALTFMLAINVKADCVSYGGSSTCLSHEGCSWDYTYGCTGHEVASDPDPQTPPAHQDPTTCPAGQGIKGDVGSAYCGACDSGWYSPANDLFCHQCTGTVTNGGASCETKTTVTIRASASRTTITGGGTATVSGTPSQSIGGSAVCSGTGVSGCTVTCPDSDGYRTVTVGWTGYDTSAYTVQSGSVTIHCVGSEGHNVDHVDSSNTTVYVSVGESVGLSLSAKDANGKAVKATWSAGNGISVSSCGTSAQCGATVTATKCGTTTATVTATGAGSNTGSDSVTITIVGYNAWSKTGDNVDVPQGKEGHTKHEAETATGDIGERCIAYENVDPSTGKGEKWDRCCGGSSTPETACYEKPDGTREITTYKSGYVKKDNKYCKKACYKKAENTYENTWYNDGYEKVEDRFCEETPQPHCYRKEDGTYVNEVYKDGYVQVDDRFCETACYKKEDGTVEKTTYQDGFVKLDDKYCEKACYKTGENKYENTYYQDGYEKVEDDKCADVPPTAATVSKIIYALSLFLVMAGSGIIVYQLTKTKKELN